MGFAMGCRALLAPAGQPSLGCAAQGIGCATGLVFPPLHPRLCHGPCCTSPDARTICRHCVCVASSRHIPCVFAVGLCVAWQTPAFLALWPSVSACIRARCSVLGTPFLALSFGGGAVTEVLHALRCGLALSPVRHDLPCKKKACRLGLFFPGGACLSTRQADLVADRPSQGSGLPSDQLLLGRRRWLA